MPADVRTAFIRHCVETMTGHGLSRDEARAVLDRHFGPSQYHSIHLQTLFDAYAAGWAAAESAGHLSTPELSTTSLAAGQGHPNRISKGR